MKQDRDFDNILDDCLERMFRDETVEQCLRLYPRQAAELEPLLRTASAMKSATTVSPDAIFRARAREEFHAALQEMEAKKGFGFLGLRSWGAAVVATILALVVLGSGTVAAAGNSMPGQPLYPVKLAKEQVQLALTFSDVGKAELYTSLTDTRVNELVYAAEEGNAEQVEQVSERLDSYLNRVTVLVAEPVVTMAGSTEPVVSPEPAPAEQPAPEVATAEPQPQPSTALTGPETPARAPRVMTVPPVEEQPPAEKQSDASINVPEETVPPPPVVAAKPAPETTEENTLPQTKIVDKRTEVKAVVKVKEAENMKKLRAALENTPESARPALKRAIEKLESSYNDIR
jgi:hypothetical protein